MQGRAVGTAIACLLLAGCLPKAPAPGEGSRQARIIPCRRAAGKIAIDGKLNDPAWDRAYVLDDFRIPPEGRKPRHPSSAQLLWDDEFLYLGVVMEDFDLLALKKERDAWLWEDDVVELFVKPSDVEPAYYEIEINPLGTVLDLLIGRRLAAGSIDRWKDWDSRIQVAISVSGTVNNWKDKDKGWIVEAAIPLSAFTPTPKPQLGDRWRFAVCRYDYSVYLEAGQELSSSARLSALDFHRFEDYDILEFAE
ncbi:MAG TPA: carbohydrate-binding family 9-like protein [Planctomycetota bacterium]|nr:carbohydrate-binding family 9-like protein [Planctomycetota bacterium]HRR81621.1 carbohydrate-binding family 9-like protein [Planctomycetota bacterium]